MRTTTSGKFLNAVIFVVVLIACGVFAWTFAHAFLLSSSEETAPVEESNYAFSDSASSAMVEPSRLRIPALNINANVQKTGVNTKGNMGVPTNFTDVAWYKDGTIPGTFGSAVIDGHIDNGLGLSGVFKHLDLLKAGDDIFIDTKGGDVIHFVVEEAVSYPLETVPIERLFNRDDRVRLNLVTCEGSWLKGEKTYDHRLIVYATLAPSTN